MPEHLFDSGPLVALQRHLGLLKRSGSTSVRRALIASVIAYAPLLILTLVFGGPVSSFLRDAGVSARFLLALPLLLMADEWCCPKLSQIPQYFLDSGMIRVQDRPRLDAIVTSTRRYLDSPVVEVLTVLVAYALVVALGRNLAVSEYPAWHVHQGTDHVTQTLAGQWHSFVSSPILIVVALGWMWRQFLFCRLLWLVSRMNLRLIASHPDNAGGLRFLESALRGYWPVAFSLSAVAAGRIGNNIQMGASLYDSRFPIAGMLVFIIVVFVAPFASFAPVLIRLRDEGIAEYGVLGRVVGDQFERKWLMLSEKATPPALEVSDFSATTDLYAIVSNTQHTRYFPVGVRSVCELAVLALLPFVPVVLFVVPFEKVVHGIVQLLL